MKDKIIFWIHSDFLQLGLAKSLQSKYDCDMYAIIDVTNKTKNFFKEQDLVKFEKIWYYHDYIKKSKNPPDLKYLSEFEKKYGINLWMLALNERIFLHYNVSYKFRYEEILSILEQECRLFENILYEIKPDFLIMPLTTFHHNALFYEMCKSVGVKILMTIPTRLSQRVMISNHPEKFDTLAVRTNQYKNRTAKELQDYYESQSMGKDTKDFLKSFMTSKSKLLLAALEFLFFSKNTNHITHYTYYGRTKLKVLKKSILDSFIEKSRKNFIDKNFIREPLNESFIFYPLHTEPERALLLAAPFYTDQLYLITTIAKSLPIGYKLYVKEHPLQTIRGWRSIQYYKQIMDIPNVRLLHPSVSTSDVIKKSSLVITVSGAIGLEAAFYGKSTIAFVETVYSELKSVYTLKSLEELPKAISTSLQKKVDPTDLNQFINDLEENSVTFPYIKLDSEQGQRFYHGGFLIDTDVEISKVRSFLEEFHSEFDILAEEHIKKIKQYKIN